MLAEGQWPGCSLSRTLAHPFLARHTAAHTHPPTHPPAPPPAPLLGQVVIKFLQLMMKHGYIGEFEYVDDHRSGKIVVELNGRLNKCGVISPRYDVGFGEIEDWIARLLPSRQFGHIVLTTSAGIMDHEEARRKKVGGKVLGFFY